MVSDFRHKIQKGNLSAKDKWQLDIFWKTVQYIFCGFLHSLVICFCVTWDTQVWRVSSIWRIYLTFFYIYYWPFSRHNFMVMMDRKPWPERNKDPNSKRFRCWTLMTRSSKCSSQLIFFLQMFIVFWGFCF